MKKILILCTGNSCRSQMAEAILRDLLPDDTIVSAGTAPEKEVNPNAIKVLQELGLNTATLSTKSVDRFLGQDFDYVITVCDSANETCPVFAGAVKNRLHLGFEDPADAEGTEDQIIATFRLIRDQIQETFTEFVMKMDRG